MASTGPSGAAAQGHPTGEAQATANLSVKYGTKDGAFVWDEAFRVNTGDRGPYYNAFGFYSERNETLAVIDNKSNSESAGILWRTSDGRRSLCINNAGNQETRHCTWNFADSAEISYRIGECDGSERDCTKIGRNSGWHNWGRWRDSEVH